MPLNHLEQIVAEWLEYQGYFVRRNIKVGKRKEGGYECELDVVALHPQKMKLVQYKPSTDADSWATREKRYKKKFDAGKSHIPRLFSGLAVPEKIEQFAVFVFGSDTNHKTVGGGTVIMLNDLLKEIVDDLKTKKISKGFVPEQYPLLRVLQLACEYQCNLFNE